MEVKNCFALKGKKCIALNGGKCKGRCAFYKTEAEAEKGRIAALKRIASLSRADECYIAINYYNGTKPWLAEVKR